MLFNKEKMFTIEKKMGAKCPKSLVYCLFVSNKRQILCGTSHNPREGLWIIKISKINLHQNSIFIKFKNSTIF